MNAYTLMATTTLSPAPTPPLNQGQRDVADAFFQFLFSDDKEMGISGPGGVGKTFLMGHLIDEIMPRYYETCKLMGIEPQFDSVEMTATTNKAADALSEATLRPTSTIHSFLGLKVMDDFATGESKLVKTNSWKVHERVILFIDECSMTDTPLDNMIQEGTHNCKIVWVGDHCQLAPIKEALSPIYRRGIPFYELTEPMRTGIPELQALNQQLRTSVETGVFLPIKIVPGIIDHLNDITMPQELARVFAGQTHSSRILAYANRRVIEFNNHIRGIRQLPDEFTEGELVVSNTAFHAKTRMISVEEEIEIRSQAANTERVFIGDGAELEVRRTSIADKHGAIFKDVLFPVDRDHYDALLKYYKSRKAWAMFYKLKNEFPDFRPRDAATTHKAQGSTYDSVFVDLGNISSCHQPNQAARLLYVALSRPRYKIFLYGDLAEKYGGLTY